ncbi:MAG: tyrosine-type recombinase/integrase [Bacteroidota bacterium]
MASVKVILRTSKTLANGNHPIAIRIIKDRKAKFIFTGKSSSKEHWDEEKGLPNKKHPLYKELVIYLKKKSLDAEAQILQLERDDTFYTADNIAETLTKTKGSTNFFDFMDKVIAELDAAGRIGSKNSYVSVMKSLLSFTKQNRNLDFKAVTTAFILKYEHYLRSKGLAESTMKFYITPILTLYHLAKKDTAPIKEYDFTKFRLRPKHRAIEKAKMETLFKYPTVEGTAQYHALNYFTFSYYCWGINMVDIAKLQWKNIQDDRLFYIRTKSKKGYSIPLLAPAKRILDLYKPEGATTDPEAYIFPILDPKKYNTPQKVTSRIKNATRSTNDALKVIAQKSGIHINLTTYVARHSFATNLRDMEISASKIQKMMGHSTERTTQGYLDSFKNNELDDAAMKLVG